MPAPFLRRSLAALLAVLLVASGAVGQVMDPPTHMLQLAKGQSDTIRVTTDCPSIIEVSTPNPALIELSDTDDQKPTQSVKVKVSVLDKPGINPGTIASVKFTITPLDGTCDSPTVLVASVIVVADGKPAAQLFKAGIKKADLPGTAVRAKAMRADLKTIVAAHRLVTKTVLQQLGNGAVTLPPVIPPGPSEAPAPPPGGFALTESERALVALGLAEFTALDRVEQAYWDFLTGLNADALAVLTLAGLTPTSTFTTPRDLQPNTGGRWDQERRWALAAMADAVRGLESSSGKLVKAVEALSRKRGETLFVRSGALSLPDPGTGGATPLSGPTIDETKNMGLAVLGIRSWNGPSVGGADLSNGRIQIIARLAGSGAFAQFQRLNLAGEPLGTPQGDSFVTDEAAHQIYVLWPTLLEPATLIQGTWRVILQGGGGNLSHSQVVVPVD